MLTICYFASLKEKLSLERERLPLPEQVSTVADLIAHLGQERGEPWRQVLGASNVLAAVNQEICEPDRVLQSGDEVAFFPPVTGG